ncbi:hypothetical protein FB45DRAFT_998846 [Roridomyces roridus]|uniref:F-box domain-containing protein n=1 Tax=Roridomyces roridus TaxID=1738132 RepID=A0AAD7CGJ2_9AGAR|nr:hypothetical protein FB45DRAFT_998846 [Roridomyces roridus]
MSSSSAEHATLPSSHPSPRWSSALLPTATETTKLTEILRCTVLPTAEETDAFRGVSSDTAADLARYDAEIASLQSLLGRLKSERELLHAHTNRCRSVLSPIRGLPAELLVEIFDMCTPPCANLIGDNDTVDMEIERLAKTHLLQLSAVCYRWYQTVMGSPKLWAVVVTDADLWNEIDVPTEHLLGRLELSLKRGANAPLVMQLALPEDEDLESSILELVSQHAHRWRDVYLWIQPSSIALLAKIRGNLPRLESFSLSASTFDPYPPGPAVFDLAPRLKNFTLTGWPLRLPEIPWAQLLDVKFLSNQASDITSGLDILSLLQRGAEYRMDLDCAIVSLDNVVSKPIVSHLSTFTVVFQVVIDGSFSQSIFRNLMESVTMPSLRGLYICRDPTGPPSFWPHAAFLSFAKRSSLNTHLTDLEIQVEIQDRELIECLELIPLLGRLVLWDCGDDNGNAVLTDFLLDRLACTEGQPNLVPRLEYCYFRTILRFSDESLDGFIRFRVGCQEEKAFEIDFTLRPTRERAFTPEFLGQMEQLQKCRKLFFTIEDIA